MAVQNIHLLGKDLVVFLHSPAFPLLAGGEGDTQHHLPTAALKPTGLPAQQ